MQSRVLTFLAVLILLASPALAQTRSCTRMIDPPRIDQNILFCAENYYPHNFPNGINITADNIIVDCGTSVFHGSFENAGFVIIDRTNITIQNCQIANYDIGMLIKNSNQITILNSNLIRNHIGLKLINSSGIVVENSYDISIKNPVQLVKSEGNSFHYLNKNLKGDGCRLNQCNTPTGLAIREFNAQQSMIATNSLTKILSKAIKNWIYPSKSIFS